MSKPVRRYSPLRRALLVALAYALGAGLWIAFSDARLALLASEPGRYAELQTWKGGVFVAVTAALLFVLLLSQFRALEASSARARRLAERLKLTLASVDDLVFVFDTDNHIVEHYPADHPLLFVPPSAFHGHPVDKVGLPAEVGAAYVAALAAVRGEGRARTIDYPLPYGGQRRWFSARLSPMTREAGTGSGEDVLAVVREITDLKSSEQRFRALFEDVEHIAVQGYDENRCVLFWNGASERLYGYRREEVLGRCFDELIVPPEGRAQARRLHRAWVEDGQPIPAGEIEVLAKDGSRVPAFSSHTMLRNARGGVEMYCVDIDLRAQAEAREQLRLAAQVFENSGEAILIVDAGHRVIAANRAFSRISGYAEAEVLGREPAFLCGEDGGEAATLAGIWAAVGELGHWQGEVRGRRRDDTPYPAWLVASAVRDEGDVLTHYIIIFADIGERKAIEARLAYLAHHDVLTGLPNRMLARDRLEQALALAARTQQRVALMFLDLDHFKIINDTLGHGVGDALLKSVATRLEGCVRRSDTVSRQGGDEFLIVLTALSELESVSRIATDILDAMAPGFEVDGHALACSFSIGIALYPDDGADFDTLLLKADTAMYHAKEAGRNAYRFFTERMNAEARERLQIQTLLRGAAERGELCLHYQPQFDLGSREVACVEALLRWNSAELGQVSPARFIPVAEESGLIVPLGEWALREACRQAESWRRTGFAVPVAVNLSALQFHRSDPVELLERVLAESGLPAAQLELELTESVLVQDSGGVTLERLRRLKALGVSLAIDDFGTGFSSLAYLRRFPIDKLKIDQAFVCDISTDPEDAAIVNLVIELGRILKIRTVAEGVESEAQLRFLAERGCDMVQGYHFARPMTAAQFEAQYRARPAPDTETIPIE
ncbi:EAL domain-containing protein [Thauera aromatica]|uniref:sensor domain-containing protein n=1 Tax=Thauera aromatica TaxID=59405 RepID=UPI001FFC79EE|nr:EAL domain-containing protein [Thauera aromatica]MCK2089721.1 EAL domain-containing protein [Thauera aromatica]